MAYMMPMEELVGSGESTWKAKVELTDSEISWDQQADIARAHWDWLQHNRIQMTGDSLVACLYQPRLGGAVLYLSTIPHGWKTRLMAQQGRTDARAWWAANGESGPGYHAEDGAIFDFETDRSARQQDSWEVVRSREGFYQPYEFDPNARMRMVVYGRRYGAVGEQYLCNGESPPKLSGVQPSCRLVARTLHIDYRTEEPPAPRPGDANPNPSKGGKGGGSGGNGSGPKSSYGKGTTYDQDPRAGYSVNNTTMGGFSQAGSSSKHAYNAGSQYGRAEYATPSHHHSSSHHSSGKTSSSHHRSRDDRHRDDRDRDERHREREREDRHREDRRREDRRREKEEEKRIAKELEKKRAKEEERIRAKEEERRRAKEEERRRAKEEEKRRAREEEKRRAREEEKRRAKEEERRRAKEEEKRREMRHKDDRHRDDRHREDRHREDRHREHRHRVR